MTVPTPPTTPGSAATPPATPPSAAPGAAPAGNPSLRRAIPIVLGIAVVIGGGAAIMNSTPFAIERVAAAPNTRAAGLAGAFLAGRHAQSVSEGSTAIGFYDQALGYDPQNLSLLTNSYFLAAQAGNFDAVFPAAKKAYDIEPRAGMAPVLLAAQAFKAKQYDQTWFYLSKTPAQSMNGFAMPMLKAWAIAPNQPIDKAIDELTLLKNFQDTGDLVEVMTGLLNEQYNNADGALTHYDNLSKRIEEQRLSVARLVAEGYQRLGKADKAKDVLKRFEAVRGTSPMLEAYVDGSVQPRKVTPQLGMAEALYASAEMLLMNDANDYRAQVATAYAQTALYMDPDLSIARRFIGTAMAARGRVEDSNAMLTSVKRSAPDYFESQMQLAENYARAKRSGDGLVVLHAVAKDKPNWAEVQIAIGDAERNDHKFPEAVTAYDNAIKLAGKTNENWALYYSRGIALERSKQWDLAEKDFHKALELKPDEPSVLNYLGYSYLDRGIKMAEARKMIETAYSKRPDDGYIMDSLGWVMYTTGEYDKAVTQLEKAVESAPADATINEHLGDAYWKAGRQKEARFQWERALGLELDSDAQRTELRAKMDHGLPQK